MTGTEIRQLRSSLGMDPTRFAQLLGIHPSSLYRWEAAGELQIRVEPFQSQVLAALQQQVAQRQAPAQADLGQAILAGLLIGGGLLGLYKLLEAVFDEPKPRRKRVAVGGATGAQRRRSPAKNRRGS
ncbi:MAG: hypothetical protein HY898_25145 [Deltaproteobacteria bacterium]|nr:hypothetical protein [Deltaproteobacteria bacterium]